MSDNIVFREKIIEVESVFSNDIDEIEIKEVWYKGVDVIDILSEDQIFEIAELVWLANR